MWPFIVVLGGKKFLQILSQVRWQRWRGQRGPLECSLHVFHDAGRNCDEGMEALQERIMSGRLADAHEEVLEALLQELHKSCTRLHDILENG